MVAFGYPAADSIVALAVAVLVLYAAGRLTTQAIDVLMDRASEESEQVIATAVRALDPRIEMRRVRIRHAAGNNFIDLVVGVASDAAFTQAHAASAAIESAVRAALPRSDVVVHVEPLSVASSLRERASAAAFLVAEVREVHNVRVMRVDEGYELSLHAKVAAKQSLQEAHAAMEAVEASIFAAVPELAWVYTHIEPLAEIDSSRAPTLGECCAEAQIAEEVVLAQTGAAPLDLRFRDGERGRIVFLTVLLSGEQSLASAHHCAGRIERSLRQRMPQLADAIVHTEPR